MDSWLVTGCEDGSINISDLATGECQSKFRHGSGSGDKYRGVTNVHCMPSRQPTAHSPLFFTGCSNGIIKAWSFPSHSASAQSPSLHSQAATTTTSSYWGIRMNLRLKQSIAVMKVHAAPITCLMAKPLETSSAWLLASGDEKGMVCLTKGSEKSSSTTCNSTNIHTCAQKTSSNSNGKSVSWAGSGKISISCLAFIGAPATSTARIEAQRCLQTLNF